MKKYIKIKINENKTKEMYAETEYYNIIKDILENNIVKTMGDFIHHGNITCLEHSINVSYLNYKICKKLKFDYISSAKAGILHDLFLYDWHIQKKENNLFKKHGFTHSKIALNNSNKYFNLNDIEKDIILKHMWPLNIALPKYKETYVIIIADKFSCMQEIISDLNIKKRVLNFKNSIINLI